MDKPTQEEGDLLFRLYLAGLRQHRSVTIVAAMHGLTVKQLSRFLNRKGRRQRWRKLRSSWKRENNTRRVSASRSRRRQRELVAQASTILALGLPLERLNPMQLKILVEAGVVSADEALRVSSRRDHWRLG